MLKADVEPVWARVVGQQGMGDCVGEVVDSLRAAVGQRWPGAAGRLGGGSARAPEPAQGARAMPVKLLATG